MVVVGPARRTGRPDRLRSSGGNRQPQIGILLRNRPAQVAALLGVLRCGATVVVINPARGDERTKADVDQLSTAADHRRARRPGDARPSRPPRRWCRSRISPTSRKCVAAGEGRTDHEAARRRGADVDQRDDRAAQTSGPHLRHAGAQRDGSGRMTGRRRPTELRRGVAIVNSPLVHIGGVFRILQCVAEARPFVLLERFELDRWAEAVRTHRPRAVSLVPAALRMVLHSDLPREDLASIRAVTSGTAPLSAGRRRRIHREIRNPGADLLCRNRIRRRRRRLDVGRPPEILAAPNAAAWDGPTPGPNCGWSTTTATRSGPTRSGCWRSNPGSSGPSADWMRTTDMARIDADGFLWIIGRADQAIIRGGFKVMPDDVRIALESHPAVRRRRGGRAARRAARARHRWPWWNCESRDRQTPARSPTTCEHGWRATRFPPTSPSSPNFREHRPASPI